MPRFQTCTVIIFFINFKSIGRKDASSACETWRTTEVHLFLRSADLQIIFGMRTTPSRSVKEDYAKGIIALFPYLADPRSRFGYIEQDFTLMFDEAISAKFLEKWPTIFKQKVLEQSRGLTQSEDLQYLLQNAQGPTEVENGKMKLITRRTLYDYLYKLVGIAIYISTGTSIQGFLDGITESLQPILLAVGTRKSVVH
ncbi:hypothetical protein FQA47_013125, partial [Oryzias melastigma]